MPQARRRRQVHPVVRLSEHPDQTPHLGQRLCPGRLDGIERLERSVRVAPQSLAGAPRLQHDDADRVGDGVMQLASDPRPLVGDRRPRLLDPGGFQGDLTLATRSGIARPASPARPVEERTAMSSISDRDGSAAEVDGEDRDADRPRTAV